MNTIKILSTQIINQIAAGEVIERPASIIKELVENSVDAGATEIEIYINNGGKTLITVKDNGKGMSKDDLSICLQMHATSKLSDDNLFNINSLGFRGEALASIAAVAKINISSYDANKKQAFSINAQNSVIDNKVSVSPLQFGTTITVVDLFFSTPARLKFLKSDTSETLQCYSIIKKIALANYKCNFKVFNNNKLVYNYKNTTTNLLEITKERLASVINTDFINNSILIDTKNELFTLYGYISTPTYNTNTSNLQYFNINSRHIKDKVISNAIKYGYIDVLEKNKYPIFGLWMEINPTELDVNVNPSKTEVRFKDSQFIRHLIHSAIKNTLSNTNNQNHNESLAQKLVDKSANFNRYNTIKHGANSDHNALSLKEPSLSNFTEYSNNKNYNNPNAFNNYINKNKDLLHKVQPSFTNSDNTLNNDFPLGFAKAQLHNNWIISQTKNGIILVDQHAAHERIMEEKLKNHYLSNTISTQQLLLVSSFNLDEQGILILQSNVQQIQKMGIHFYITHNTVHVTALPSLISNASPKNIIMDIINNIKDGDNISSVEEQFKIVISKLACHYSIRSVRIMTIPEMNDLLRTMEQTPNYGECSHGRPTFMEISLHNLEGIFGRLG